MAVHDVARYNELSQALNKPQVEARAGDSSKLEKVFYGIYLQQNQQVIDKFCGVLESLVQQTKQYKEENQKLTELQSKVQAVFEKREPEAITELKQVAQDAYHYANEIANNRFSPADLFPLILSLKNIPPSVFERNHLAAFLKETAVTLLLEQLPKIKKGETDAFFHFLASFSDAQLEEICQKYILQADLARQEEIASFLQTIMMNAKKSKIQKTERDLGSIRLFCTLVLPLCREKNVEKYVNNLFVERIPAELTSLLDLFRDVKKTPPPAFNPLPLILDQLGQMAGKITDFETFFIKLFQEVQNKHDRQVATGKKTTLIPLQEFMMTSGKKVILQKHVRVLLGQKPTLVLKHVSCCEKAAALAKSAMQEAEKIPSQERVTKRRYSIMTNVCQPPKKMEKVSAAKSQVTSRVEAEEIVPMEVQEGQNVSPKLILPQVHVKRHIELHKKSLVEIFNSKISNLLPAAQEQVKKFLQLNWPLTKVELEAGFDFVRQNIALPPECSPLLADLKIFVQDSSTPEGVKKLLLSKLFIFLQEPTTISLAQLSGLFGAAIYLRDSKNASYYNNKIESEQTIYEAARSALKAIYEKNHPAKIARPEEDFQKKYKDNLFSSRPRGDLSGDVYDHFGIYYQNRYAVQVAGLLQDSEGQINRYLGYEELLCLFPGNSEFDIRARETYTLFKKTDALNQVLQCVQPPRRGNVAGEWTVRSTLLLDEKEPITKKHVRQIIFGSAMSRWSQEYYHSCATTAIYLLLEAVSLKWIVEDFVEIIEKGTMTREVNGHPYDFITLPAAMPSFIGMQIAEPPYSAEKISQLCQTLYSFQDIGHVFSIAKIEQSDLRKLINAIASREKPVTFQAILEERRTELESAKTQPAANQKLIAEQLDALEKNRDYLLFLIGSTFEMSLVRLWENSAMCLTAPPMSEFVERNTIGKMMSLSLAKAFLEVGKKVVTKLESGASDEKAFAANLSKALESVPRLLRTMKRPINFYEYSAKQPVQRMGLRVSSKKAEHVKDKDATSIEKAKVGPADFSQQMIDIFSQFRFVFGPSSDPDDYKVHCKLYVKLGEEFVKIENEGQFKAKLEAFFYEFVHKIYDRIPTKPVQEPMEVVPGPSPKEEATKLSQRVIPPVQAEIEVAESPIVPIMKVLEIVSQAVSGEELYGTFCSWFTTFFSASDSFRVGRPTIQDKPWDFALEGMAPADIFTAATSRITKQVQPAKSLFYPLIVRGRLSPGFLDYAREVGRQFSYDKNVVVNTSIPDHSFRFYPNRAFRIPEGMSSEDWIAAEESRFFSLVAADFPQTVKKMQYWSMRAEGVDLKELKKSVDKWVSNKKISLYDFLNGVYKCVMEAIEQQVSDNDKKAKLKALMQRNFHFDYLIGRGLDKKNDWSHGILYFGDPLWKEAGREKMVPVEYLLYFNPLKKQWDLIYFAFGGKYIPQFEEVDEQQVLLIDTFDQAQVLKEPMEQKRICLLTDEINTKMEKIGATFLPNFEALEERVKTVASATREKIQKLFSQPLSVLSARDALQDLKKTKEIPDDLIDILLTLVQQKEKQQVVVDEICTIQNPPVDQLTDALFITGFEPQTPKFEALKGDFDEFRVKIYDLCALDPQTAPQKEASSAMEVS